MVLWNSAEAEDISRNRRPAAQSPSERRQQRREALRSRLRVICLAFPIAGVILCSLLTYDLPIFWFDAHFGGMTRPSSWLRVGDMLMALSLAQVLILTRQYGGTAAKKVLISAWLIAAVVTAWFLVEIHQGLQASDMPGIRFTVAVIGGWSTGHLLGVTVYGLKRGGIWWHAPLYAGLVAFGGQSLLFFTINFLGNGHSTWLHWFVIDYCIKAGYTVVFVMAYGYVRRTIQPMSGYGG